MLGERLASVLVEQRGLEKDRLFAVRDGDGKLGSGKSTRRFRAMDGLFEFAAIYESGKMVLRLPDGSRLAGDEPGIHATISHWLGHEVTLAREATVSHFDAAPLHLLTTSSLRFLQQLLPLTAVDERRFRPSLVIETRGADLVEDGWVGRTVAIGDVRLVVTQPTERCVMTTFSQSELEKAPEVLRTITQRNQACLGVYATVIAPGMVKCGDRVELQ